MANKSKRKKRLVYSPKAYVFIHSRKLALGKLKKSEREKLQQDSKTNIIDVTNDVVGGIVNRLINQPSTATITLNNRDFKYTGRFDPVFLPMDGITIWLERIAGKPIQVFTGYIDEIPYYQMYPGTIQIRATCTLKRLMYTYFDPGTQAMGDFFTKNGWTFDYTTGLAYNADAISPPVSGKPTNSDSGFGKLLYNFMHDVCNWDPQAVVISNLPDALPDSLAGIYQDKIGAGEQAYQDSVTLFRKLLTMHPNSSSGSGKDSASPGVVASKKAISEIRQKASTLNGITVYEVFLAAIVMTKIDREHYQTSREDEIDYGVGIFAIPPPKTSVSTSSKQTPGLNPAAAMVSKPTQTQVNTPLLPSEDLSVVNTAIEKFYRIYLETVKNQGYGQKTQAEKVAITLSLGMGKEKFYTEIFQACKDETNIKIAKALSNPSKGDNVNSMGPDVLMAQEVYKSSLPNSGTTDARVTWDSLMGVAGAPDSIERGLALESKSRWGDSLADGSIYRVVAEIDNTGGATTVYDDTLKQKIKIDLNKLKYYVVEYGREKPSTEALKDDRTVYSLGGRKIGDLIRIVNPKSGGSVVAMVADFKKAPQTFTGMKSHVQESQIGLSPAVVTALGLKNEDFQMGSGLGWPGGTSTNGLPPTILIETAGATRFSQTDIKDKEVTAAALNNTAALGIKTDQSQEKVFLTINQNDIDNYNNYYKGSVSEVLADYFYIANDMGLRLGTSNYRGTLNDGTSKDKNILEIQNDSSNVNSTALQNYAKEISKNVGVNVCIYNDGKNAYFYRNGVPGPAKSMGVAGGAQFSISGVPTIVTGPSVLIRVDENAPRPIYNGAPVHLPEVTPTADDKKKVGITWQDLAKLGMASAFTSIFSFPVDAVESSLLTGDKALMNDIPVLKGVQQLAQGSMRQIMSLPNGQFCAFYPDYFGKYGRLPYWKINEIEIEELNITYNDNELVTHMFVNGAVNNPMAGISLWDRVTSMGMVNIQDAINSDFISDSKNIEPVRKKSGGSMGTAQESYNFLQTYGARKLTVDDPLIRNPYFEFVSAYNQFLYHWAKVHAAIAKISFQPEVMTGGLVSFPEHDLILYAEQVTHTWDYSSGFTTQVVFTCPSTSGETPQLPKFG